MGCFIKPPTPLMERVIALHREGMTARMIARRVDKHPSLVFVYLHRARLRGQLKDDRDG